MGGLRRLRQRRLGSARGRAPEGISAGCLRGRRVPARRDPEVKAVEARLAIEHGATERDMVLDVGGLKSGDLPRVERDVAPVAETCRGSGARCKVILETALLSAAEKVAAARLAVEAGAGFVKTATGFGPGGATVADVRLLRETVGPEIGVKASGGIRTLSAALAMLVAGANRLGLSATGSILEAARRELGA
jgi:deoxyribose-phosphate aldolase